MIIETSEYTNKAGHTYVASSATKHTLKLYFFSLLFIFGLSATWNQKHELGLFVGATFMILAILGISLSIVKIYESVAITRVTRLRIVTKEKADFKIVKFTKSLIQKNVFNPPRVFADPVLIESDTDRIVWRIILTFPLGLVGLLLSKIGPFLGKIIGVGLVCVFVVAAVWGIFSFFSLFSVSTLLGVIILLLLFR